MRGVVLAVCALLAGCASRDVIGARPPVARAAEVQAPPLPVAPSREVTEDGRLVLAFGGDVIAHEAVRVAAARGGYEAIAEGAREALHGVDLAFANLESPVTERAVRRGDMIFHADDALVGAIRGVGFEVVSVANNHAYDQGRAGLADTLEAVERHGLVAVGAGATYQSACEPRWIERRGIRIAFLARTLVMNFEEAPARGMPEVCMLAEGPLQRAARAARAAGADLVIASLHWGNEYERAPRREQVEAAHRLAGAGVDLVIGHHPHVLQPVESVRGPSGHETLVAYSLGNLISNQGFAFEPARGHEPDGDTRDVAILRVVVEKVAAGATRIADVSAIPLWTEHDADGAIRLVPATARRERIAARLGVPLADAASGTSTAARARP